MAKKVLIVEDNPLNARLFHDLLEANGYETIQVDNANDALRLAHQHLPNLVLMDIQLPEISGVTLINWFKNDEFLKEIPIIAVTAFAMKGDEEKILDQGCKAYIAKPISVVDFIKTVNLHI
jgi:two-component system cell cycle response regulator DivK